MHICGWYGTVLHPAEPCTCFINASLVPEHDLKCCAYFRATQVQPATPTTRRLETSSQKIHLAFSAARSKGDETCACTCPETCPTVHHLHLLDEKRLYLSLILLPFAMDQHLYRNISVPHTP